MLISPPAAKQSARRCCFPLRPWPAAIFAAMCLLATMAFAEVPPAEFIRLAHDDAGQPMALQVAVVQYRDGRGRTLDLVSAVHVADREYFRDLDRRFDDYDRVLFELVGDPKGTSAGGSAGPGLALVGLMQVGLTGSLNMAHQLEEIDYDRPHFVHADMTMEEFQASMAERNESMLGTMFQLWAVSMALEASGTRNSNAALVRVLLAEDRHRAFKRMLAETLAEQQLLLRILDGDQGSTLISERNRKALSVLESELASGARRLALFYGAGHMADFHRRLVTDHGFTVVGSEWLTAWDLQ